MRLRKSFRVMDRVEALILRIRKDPPNVEIRCFSICLQDIAMRYGVIAYPKRSVLTSGSFLRT